MNFLKTSWSYILGMNLAYLLVLGLVVKALVSDISYPAFLVAIPVLGYEGYKLYLKSKKPDPVRVNQEVQNELEAMKSKLSGLTMEKTVSPNKRYF